MFFTKHSIFQLHYVINKRLDPQFDRKYGFDARLLCKWKSAEKLDSCQQFDVANPGCVFQEILGRGLKLQ